MIVPGELLVMPAGENLLGPLDNPLGLIPHDEEEAQLALVISVLPGDSYSRVLLVFLPSVQRLYYWQFPIHVGHAGHPQKV